MRGKDRHNYGEGEEDDMRLGGWGEIDFSGSAKKEVVKKRWGGWGWGKIDFPSDLHRLRIGLWNAKPLKLLNHLENVMKFSVNIGNMWRFLPVKAQIIV